MNLATYYQDGPRVGVADGGMMWDLRRVMALFLFEVERNVRAPTIAAALVPDDMALFVRINHGGLAQFRDALAWAAENRESLRGSVGTSQPIATPLDDVRLLPPIVQPSKVICVGNSYADYLVDQKLPKDEWPKDVKISFLKSPTALIGHREPIRFPPDSTEWDYENELTIVVGRTCQDVSQRDADRYIFGYTILNDACIRDVPKWSGRYDSPRGKACDTFAPCGPWIVPTEDLGADPNDLSLRTWVDDELRQDVRTSGLMWPVQRILAFVSRYITLAPGDVISTGSGGGNALTGPGDWMRPGRPSAARHRGSERWPTPLHRVNGDRRFRRCLPSDLDGATDTVGRCAQIRAGESPDVVMALSELAWPGASRREWHAPSADTWLARCARAGGRLADRAAARDPGVWQRHRHAARRGAALHARHAALRVCAAENLVRVVAFGGVRGVDGQSGARHRRISCLADRADGFAASFVRRPVHAGANPDAFGAADQRLDPAARSEERHDQPDRPRLVRSRGTGAGHLLVLGHGLGGNAAGTAACVPVAVARVPRDES
jgi:2-keto-4-pentenoate hydratase/2-oxohepta-3-ene-1,7-dioic acid hydratase in catechol pathway